MEEVWVEAFELELAVGWLGTIGLLLLAITSNNASVSRLGRKWKTLQRLVYPIAVCVFVHWLLFDFLLNDFVFYEVFYWFIPLVILQTYRVIKTQMGRKPI